MALSVTDIANLLFKKLQGKSSVSNDKEFFEEPRDSRVAVFTSQIWSESAEIPGTAPTLGPDVIDGVVQYKDKLSLTAIPGETNAFYSDDLKDAIPFNFGDGSYNYKLFDSTDSAINFGQGDWIVDIETGTVTFYGSVPANMPPTISFYKYVGQKADVGGLGGGGGGSSLNFYKVDKYASPLDVKQDIINCWEFSQNGDQYLFLEFTVPKGYKTGSQIKLNGGLFLANSTASTTDVLFATTTYLLKHGNPMGTIVGSYTGYNSTNAPTLIGTTANIGLQITDIDLTDSDGQINGEDPVPEVDKILVMLQRNLSGEANSFPGDVRLIKNSFNLSLKD